MLLPAPVAAAGAWPSGIYSSVYMDDGDSGDLDGFEVRFFDRGGQHFVEFVSCEGWCNETLVSPVSRTGAFYSFSFNEVDGSRAGRHTVFAHLIQTRAGFHLEAIVNGRPENLPAKVTMLKLSRKPYGLDIAHDTMRECQRNPNCGK